MQFFKRILLKIPFLFHFKPFYLISKIGTHFFKKFFIRFLEEFSSFLNQNKFHLKFIQFLNYFL